MGPTISSGNVTGIVLPNGDVEFSSPDNPRTFLIPSHELEAAISFLLEARGLDLEPHNEEGDIVDRLQEGYLIGIRTEQLYLARVVKDAIVAIRNLRREKAPPEPTKPDERTSTLLRIAEAFLTFSGLSRWRHEKRGTTYRLWTDKAALQIDAPLVSAEDAIRLEELDWCIYITEDPDNPLYRVCIRPDAQFKDGRFTRIE